MVASDNRSRINYTQMHQTLFSQAIKRLKYLETFKMKKKVFYEDAFITVIVLLDWSIIAFDSTIF